MEKYCLVFTSCPDRETAEALTERLLEQRLAACVSHLPGVVSHYCWQGRREQAAEVLLMIKSRVGRYPDLERCLRKEHPYELPEIVMVPIDKGLPEYLTWIDKMTEAGAE